MCVGGEGGRVCVHKLVACGISTKKSSSQLYSPRPDPKGLANDDECYFSSESRLLTRHNQERAHLPDLSQGCIQVFPWVCRVS